MAPFGVSDHNLVRVAVRTKQEEGHHKCDSEDDTAVDGRSGPSALGGELDECSINAYARWRLHQ